MSTWIQKTPYANTFQAIENLLSFAFKERTTLGIINDPTMDDFEIRRMVLLVKQALYQLFETKEAQLNVTIALAKLDHDQLPTLKDQFPDKTVTFMIQQTAPLRQKAIEKLQAEMKENRNTVIGNILLEDMLIYPDNVSKLTTNPQIENQLKLVHTAIDDLLKLLSKSKRIKNNIEEVRDDFHQISLFKVQIDADLKLAIERAKLFHLRKKLKSMIPETTEVEIEEEQKENSPASTNASQKNSTSKRHGSFSLEAAEIESYLESLTSETSTNRDQVKEKSQKIIDMQTTHDKHVESINQLNADKQALEQNIQHLSQTLEQKNQALAKMEDYNKEMERWKDKSKKHSRNLDVQITQARDQLKAVATQADQIRWLKWFGITMIALVGLGLSASGIGSLAGLPLLSGLGLAFGISGTATGGFFLLISALFYRQENYVIGLSKSMSDALAPKEDTSEDMQEEITQLHGNTNNLVNDLLTDEHHLPEPQADAEEVVGNVFQPPKPFIPVILDDVKYVTNNTDESSITTNNTKKIPGWTFASCFHGIFNAGKRIFSSAEPQSPTSSNGENNLSTLLGTTIDPLQNPQQMPENDANKAEEPVIAPAAQINAP